MDREVHNIVQETVTKIITKKKKCKKAKWLSEESLQIAGASARQVGPALQLCCTGFALQWLLLLQSMGSGWVGFRKLQFMDSRAWAR